ncbi:MAG: hypothetical protein H7248_03270 [Microbacteriaceae bacterium]|nr:hypothetical protein [Microbacteriaceae bacterium]
MAVVLLLYLVLVAQLAGRLIAVDNVLAKGLGIALVVLGMLGLWALVAEIVFGARSQRLSLRIISEDAALTTQSGAEAVGSELLNMLPRRPSGRPIRSAADAEFPRFQAEVEASPGVWQNWFRLGLAYDACGDRRRARQSIRRAIALSRTQ